MQGFLEVFEDYGADYEETMARFLNNKKMYLRLLNMLFQDDNLKKLGAALEANDLNGAFEAAHTLKGVVGNLGLKPLYDAVDKLVEPLRAKEIRNDYPVLYQAVELEFERAEEFMGKLKKSDSGQIMKSGTETEN